MATYDMLRQGGYTDMVVYLAQQIQQFRLLGKEFAMQHLGTEDELTKVLHDIVATMSPEERLDLLSPDELHDLLATLPPDELHDLLATLPPEERLEGLSAKKRLEGLSPEERLEGLTPAERERLRLLLQQPPPAETESARGK